jgi:hypothetical protein
MSLRRSALVLVAAGMVALVAALPVSAKEDVKATLATSIPLDAPPGTQLTVAWRLFSVDEHGRREPFGANGVFVRLLSTSGATATEGVAPVGAHATGEYEATVVVPEGGIRDIELGLAGWVSDAKGTRRSDLIFPITNDPIPTPAPLVSPGAAPDAFGATSIEVLLGVASLLFGLVVLVVAVALRRRRQDAPLGSQTAVDSPTRRG